MSIHFAKVELVHSAAAGIALPPISRPARITSLERPTAAARGIVTAVLIAVPFWALFAFTLYLLI